MSNFPLEQKGKAYFPAGLQCAFCLLTLGLHPGGVLGVLHWSPVPSLLRTGLPPQATRVDPAMFHIAMCSSAEQSQAEGGG